MQETYSKVYFAVQKEHEVPTMIAGLATSSEEAKQQASREVASKPKPSPRNEDAASLFLSLMREAEQEIAAFKSIDLVLGFLMNAGGLIQFSFTIEPALNKFAHIEEDNSNWTVYSFDKSHLGSFSRTMTYRMFRTIE